MQVFTLLISAGENIEEKLMSINGHVQENRYF